VSSGNPVFSNEMFAGYDQVYGAPRTRSTTTTVQGTIGKTALLLAILSFTALWAWNAVGSGQFPRSLFIISLIGTGIVGLITYFKPSAAPVTAPIYAALEGVFLGAVSQVFEMFYHARFPGIALQAVGLTAGVTFVMLFIYATGLVRVTEKLRAGIMIATGALGLFYLATILMRMFGAEMPLVWSATPMGIGFSVLWSGWRRSTCCWTSTSSRRPSSTRPPSTWSGTARSA